MLHMTYSPQLNSVHDWQEKQHENEQKTVEKSSGTESKKKKIVESNRRWDATRITKYTEKA